MALSAWVGQKGADLVQIAPNTFSVVLLSVKTQITFQFQASVCLVAAKKGTECPEFRDFKLVTLWYRQGSLRDPK